MSLARIPSQFSPKRTIFDAILRNFCVEKMTHRTLIYDVVKAEDATAFFISKKIGRSFPEIVQQSIKKGLPKKAWKKRYRVIS